MRKSHNDPSSSSALPLGQRKVGLQPADEGSNAAMVTTVTDTKGVFCFKVSSGNYVIQNLVGSGEYKQGLRLVPEMQAVEISNKPFYDVVFKQELTRLTGSVKCLKEAAQKTIKIHLEDSTEHRITRAIPDNSFTFNDILPGSYKVIIDYPQWCWAETEISVKTEIKQDGQVTFTQTGFIMELQSSHAATLNVSHEAPGRDETVNSFTLEQGLNRFCLKKPGQYKLAPYSCHKFERESYHYDTEVHGTLDVLAIEHLVQGDILSAEAVPTLSVLITNVDTLEKKTIVATEIEKTEEFTRLRYTFWSKGQAQYLIKPTSDSLLFAPPSHSVTVSEVKCPTKVPASTGRPGTFISGVIKPPVKGVLVTLTSPDNNDLKHTQVTDQHGTYNIGPLHNNLRYEVTAQKQDYEITKVSDESNDFNAVKLSKLTVTVSEGDEDLPGVLVSVSGSHGYRNNVLLQERSLVLTGLVPGDYFVRPIMKEYEFTPASKMLTVKEGLEVSVELAAKRTAYSLYGKITTLNGKAEKGVHLEAVGAGKCALQEEGVTDEEGSYRIRGIPPTCPITVSVRTDKSETIRRASPSSLFVQASNKDTQDLDFVVFHKLKVFDITGYVSIPEDFISSAGVLLIEESSKGKVIHTHPLDSSKIFVFPNMPLSSSYTVKLETSLSSSMYSYKIPEVSVRSEGSFQHIDLIFTPIRKAAVQEQATKASFTALAVIVLSMVLAANHATLVPVFTQVFQSVMNRSQGDSSHHGDGGGGSASEYIDDIHRGVRKRSSKKR